MASFKSTIIPKYPRIGLKSTPDTEYWKKFGFPFTVKEFGGITHVDFSPVNPYYLAATSSTRVQIYNSQSNKIYRNLSRFRVEAYGGTFRHDGQLLVAGDDEGIVRVFDLATKNVLRYYKGHNGPIHKCAFLSDNTRIVSFSDDKSVGIWDLASESQLGTLSEHKDYIRTGAVSLINPDIFLSGSYDHTVKMYDLRSNSCTLTVDHGSPVEALLLFPSSGLFISAGSVEMKVWDAVVGGRLLAILSQHYKTITALSFASDNHRIISGGLDGHVKVFDVSTYQAVHSMKYPSPILSLGIAADDSALAVGMSDGLLSIQQKKLEISKEEKEEKKKRNYRKDKIAYKFMLEAKSYQPLESDVIVSQKKRRLTKCDRHLKEFNHTKALDCALKSYKLHNRPEIVIGIFQELMRRGALLSAVGGRNGRSLAMLIKFLLRYICDSRFMHVLTDVTNILLDIYSSEFIQYNQVHRLLNMLRSRLRTEVRYMKEMMTLKGTIEILLAAANSQASTPNNHTVLESNHIELQSTVLTELLLN